MLAQQIVAEVAAQDWDEQGLFECLRRAWPYRELSRATFDQIVQMLSDGFSTRVGRRVPTSIVTGLMAGSAGARVRA